MPARSMPNAIACFSQAAGSSSPRPTFGTPGACSRRCAGASGAATWILPTSTCTRRRGWHPSCAGPGSGRCAGTPASSRHGGSRHGGCACACRSCIRRSSAMVCWRPACDPTAMLERRHSAADRVEEREHAGALTPWRTAAPTRLLHAWWSAIDQHATALLWGAIVIYIVAFAILSSLKLAWLRQGFDIAGNEQVIWNTLHGRPFRSSIFAFMQYDFDDGPVLLELPLALLYGIHQSPYTLLALQTLALGLAAWPIYLLGRDILVAPWQALALALIYLLHPTTQHINMYEFQLRSFMIPFAVGALLFLRRGRLIPYLIC